MNTFLSQYKILDLSQYIPGPYATRQLADLGANVIKVEPPAGDPMRHFISDSNKKSDYSPIYQHLNRGKRIVNIDLKQASGKESLRKLIKDADVLLESFRPGVMARLGFDRASLDKINPTLIHCALSGFGQNGPYEQRAGHDLTYCAVSGALSNSGTRERPVMSFPPIADHAGAMQAANTILAALLSRTHTHQGAFIDISLYESALAWQYLNFYESANNENPQRETLLLNGGAAYYNIYQTADGRFIALGPIEAKFWVAFCEAVSKPEWIDRQTDALPQTSLIQSLSDMFKSETLSHWNVLFENVDCCYEPILLADEVAKHPQVISRNNLKDANPQFAAWVDGQAVETADALTLIDNVDDINWVY
ncbi:CoA transferase [Cocleimonas sp. KMM 6892]|uniref:CaiB/BaiF CoA transferase family protein n=1 Tax=unclassified Cocleimonas TaxID=2639732 RepID=UPI002DC054F7|nr:MULTISPECIES: CoA transferase [unclassified Cocleimonas]MEB8434346.1 CoA transferase [Cocleimonas sp. KMM 6892]MEC4717251.1 CoA transferase [Cocleimonas sp. KMM 6895]MEC4746630.1 CoA transferase [Cocleimonas sp. KMM 6896]